MIRNLAFGLILLVGTASAVFENLRSGPVSDGLAGTFTSNASGTEAVYYNPAGLSYTHNYTVGAFYKTLYGGLNVGLRNFQFTAAIPVSRSIIAISFKETGAQLSSVGYDTSYTGAYREDTWTVTLARKMTKDLSVGLNFHYYQFREPRFGGTGTFGIDLGVISQIYERWKLGGYIGNLNGPSIHGLYRDYPIPTLIAVGISYSPWQGVNTSIQAEKTPDWPTRFSLGQEIFLAGDKIALRAGISTQGELITPTIGFGVNTKNITLNYAGVFHIELPLSHVFGISYRF